LVERFARHVDRALWACLPPDPPPGIRDDWLTAVAGQTAGAVNASLVAGALPMVLGIERLPVALGILAGLQTAEISAGVVWFDSTDPLDPGSDPEVAPLVWVVDEPHPLARKAGVRRPVETSRVLLAGIRESVAREHPDTAMWSAGDLQLVDPGASGRDVAGWPSVYLHLDLGVLDPAIMPAAARPIEGGLTTEALVTAVDSVVAHAPVVAVGVTGFSPGHDIEGLGLATSMEVLERIVQILAA